MSSPPGKNTFVKSHWSSPIFFFYFYVFHTIRHMELVEQFKVPPQICHCFFNPILSHIVFIVFFEELCYKKTSCITTLTLCRQVPLAENLVINSAHTLYSCVKRFLCVRVCVCVCVINEDQASHSISRCCHLVVSASYILHPGGLPCFSAQ